MQEFERKLAEWMRGRRGADALSVALVTAAVVLSVVNLFVHARWIGWAGLGFVAVAVWRICSKDVAARARENDAFERLVGPAARFFRNPRAAVEETRTHKHAKCPSCGQGVRVPRGKGRLRVTCPACGNRFEVKS